MSTRWVRERSATEAGSLLGDRRRRRRTRGDRRRKLAQEVALEFLRESAHILRRLEAPAQAHPIGERQRGPREDRSPLAEEFAPRLDEDHLDRHARVPG